MCGKKGSGRALLIYFIVAYLLVVVLVVAKATQGG